MKKIITLFVLLVMLFVSRISVVFADAKFCSHDKDCPVGKYICSKDHGGSIGYYSFESAAGGGGEGRGVCINTQQGDTSPGGCSNPANNKCPAGDMCVEGIYVTKIGLCVLGTKKEVAPPPPIKTPSSGCDKSKGSFTAGKSGNLQETCQKSPQEELDCIEAKYRDSCEKQCNSDTGDFTTPLDPRTIDTFGKNKSLACSSKCREITSDARKASKYNNQNCSDVKIPLAAPLAKNIKYSIKGKVVLRRLGETDSSLPAGIISPERIRSGDDFVVQKDSALTITLPDGRVVTISNRGLVAGDPHLHIEPAIFIPIGARPVPDPKYGGNPLYLNFGNPPKVSENYEGDDAKPAQDAPKTATDSGGGFWKSFVRPFKKLFGF